jgi:uncharacterized membrane protein
MEPKFTISDVFKTAWRCTKEQIWVLAGLYIGYVILSMIIALFAMPAQSSITGQIIVNLISLIFTSAFYLGYYKNMFQALDGEEPQFSAYGQQSRKIITFIVATFLSIIIMLLGMCLFIVPGFYLAFRLQFSTAFIIEEDAGIIESLKRSWEITKGQGMQLFLLFLTMMLVMLIGFILVVVGVFVAIPVVHMMYCYTFRKLNTLTLSSSTEN